MSVSLKKLSLNQWLQLLLVVALVVNCIVHFTSPAYRHYTEISHRIEQKHDDFEKRVQSEFLPSIVAIATNVLSVVDGSSSSNSVSVSALALSSDTNSTTRLFSLDYHYFVDRSAPCFEIDGRYYCIGDTFFGSPVRVISPTIIVTDDYQFARPLLSHFDLSRSSNVSHGSLSSTNFVPPNPSVVVPQSPDRYFGDDPYRRFRK